MTEDNDASKEPRAHPHTAQRELDAVNTLVAVLQTMPSESVGKVLRTVSTFLGLETSGARGHDRSSGQAQAILQANSFSEDRAPSPKEFMIQKKPMTDVERIATLAYYLTHYRSMPSFKTLDLSRLNTEAAQVKFSNPAFAVNNAVNGGFVIPAAHGAKQLSAGGELFVQNLPDRSAARAAMAQFRRARKTKKHRSGPNAGHEESGDND
jgi:hypothetical protein